MKNIKDITLLAFAVVGFYTIITAFSSTESNQPQPQLSIRNSRKPRLGDVEAKYFLLFFL